MAIATSTAIALALAAAAAGGTYYNTEHTAKRQDEQAAQSIRNQSAIQKKADAKVNEEVQKLQGSNSADERATRLDDYMSALRRSRATASEGLTPNIGSSAFRADASDAATGVQDYAAKTADLLSRIDAPTLQRQGEGFDYGNLATDIGLVGRESQGQAFIDRLRQNAIRRNAKIDLAAGLLSAAGGAVSGGAGAAAGAGGSTAGYWTGGNSLTGGTYGGPGAIRR